MSSTEFLTRRYTKNQEIYEKILNISNHQKDANQNVNTISSHPRNTVKTAEKHLVLAKDGEKEELLYCSRENSTEVSYKY